MGSGGARCPAHGLRRPPARAFAVPTFFSASPPPPPQASAPYTRLQRLTLKLSPDDDLPAILASVHPGTLPALRCLALLAGAPAGAAADLSALRHPALRRLDLRGVQLPAGFASLRHLTGEPLGVQGSARLC